MKKEKYNIKNSIYLNNTLETKILKIADDNNCNYQKTLRYLLNKGIEQHNKARG